MPLSQSQYVNIRLITCLDPLFSEPCDHLFINIITHILLPLGYCKLSPQVYSDGPEDGDGGGEGGGDGEV